jgi:hypothetical protein
MTTLELLALAAPTAIAVLGGLIWLVRLEGRVSACATSNALTDARVSSYITRQDAAHDDLIRVQEQLKYVTSLLERLVARPTLKREGAEP